VAAGPTIAAAAATTVSTRRSAKHDVDVKPSSTPPFAGADAADYGNNSGGSIS